MSSEDLATIREEAAALAADQGRYGLAAYFLAIANLERQYRIQDLIEP